MTRGRKITLVNEIGWCLICKLNKAAHQSIVPDLKVAKHVRQTRKPKRLLMFDKITQNSSKKFKSVMIITAIIVVSCLPAYSIFRICRLQLAYQFAPIKMIPMNKSYMPT